MRRPPAARGGHSAARGTDLERGAQNFPDEEDVAGDPLALLEGHVDVAPPVGVDGAAVGALDALGVARGARGVDHVGQVVRGGPHASGVGDHSEVIGLGGPARGGALASSVRFLDASLHLGHPVVAVQHECGHVRRNIPRQLRRRQHGHGARVVQDVEQEVLSGGRCAGGGESGREQAAGQGGAGKGSIHLGVRGLKGHVGATGLEDGDVGKEVLSAPVHVDANDLGREARDQGVCVL